MNRFFICALALIGALNSVQAKTPSPQTLNDRAIERRAVEAAIWGMPAVNYDLMLQEMLTKTPGKVNQAIYWGCPVGLAEPDADAQSGYALFHGVPEHQGCRADRYRSPPRRGGRFAERQFCQYLAAAA